MIPLTPPELVAVTGGSLSREVDLEASLTGVVIDSRQAGPGIVFVAVPGERADGADFVDDAVRRGSPLAIVGRPVAGPAALVDNPVAALGVLAEVSLRRARNATGRPKVIGVTGSVGKTTTKDLLARIAAAEGPTVAPKGSFNNHLGVPLTVTRITPETRYLVVELGANHEGEIAGLAQIAPPDVAVVLGVSAAHIGEFGSIDAIGRAKGELVSGLAPGGVAVLNFDDRRVAAMSYLTEGEIITFGFDSMARITGHDVSESPEGHLVLTVEDQDAPGKLRITTRLTGEQLAINVLAALAAAVAAGVPFTRAAAALEGVRPLSPHRMALTELAGGVTLVDDAYNASPESMAGAIKTVARRARQSGRRATAVLGAMLELGAASEAAHLAAGELVAKEGYDRLIVAGEEARGIYDGALAAGLAPEAAEIFPSISAADLADHLAATVQDGFALLKASHGTGLWRVGEDLVERLGVEAGPTETADGGAGRDGSGLETAEGDAAGRDAAGRDAAGRDAAGRDAAGRDAAGRDAAGRDAAGPNDGMGGRQC
ncbi:MAG: UDP-N-acetylmuramoyl-tripeptide--D-alanyl-D-alanine ligase [Bifidobacteriaceae bacterium]|jgi:UDP-N-acetylmuramoyl-tripeptide--D-alanyl-D-alanine ligase|nr:UDP-N-acetylmuramoyl-tripeptide--D-alanyl-D-alanine ligase [Bifidobacteriaceae bacterium]